MKINNIGGKFFALSLTAILMTGCNLWSPRDNSSSQTPTEPIESFYNSVSRLIADHSTDYSSSKGTIHISTTPTAGKVKAKKQGSTLYISADYFSEISGISLNSIKEGGSYLMDNGECYLSADVLMETYGYRITSHSSGDITLRKAFETKRLVLSDMPSDFDATKYGASDVVYDGVSTYVLQYSSIDSAASAYNLLCDSYSSEQVEEDFVICLPQDTATAAVASYSWGVSHIGADVFSQNMSSSQKAKQVIVAVVDTGITTSHPFYKNRLVAGASMIGSSYEDGNGHGTHVSGIITDVTSAANVKIMPVQVLDSSGSGTMLTVANGINWAVNNGCNIINLSLGGYDTSYSHYLDTAINNAIARNVTVIAASGNDNASCNTFCPAHIAGVICVGALDSRDNLAYFSNYGSNLCVAAPGVDIYSSYMNNGYSTLSGTSMAAPHASGACALLMASGLASSPAKIASLLKEHAIDLGTIGWDQYYGYGSLYIGSIDPRGYSEETTLPVVTDPTTTPTTEVATTEWQRPTTAPSTSPTTSQEWTWDWTWPWDTTESPTTPVPTTRWQPPTTQVPTTRWQPPTTQAPTTRWQPPTTQAPTTRWQPPTTQVPTAIPSTSWDWNWDWPWDTTEAPTTKWQAPTTAWQWPTTAYEDETVPYNSGISVSVSSSSTGSGNQVVIFFTTATPLSELAVLVDNKDFKSHVYKDNGKYYLDVSSLSAGYHQYWIGNNYSNANGSFTK